MEDLIDEGQQTNLRFYYNVKTLFYITFAATALATIFFAVRFFLILGMADSLKGLQTGYFTISEFMVYANRVDMVALISAIFALIGMIAFFMWLYRAYYNLEVVKLKGLNVTAGWAVGWFFIPFANFYYIVVIINDLFRGTKQLSLGISVSENIARMPANMLGLVWLLLSITASIFSNFGLERLQRNRSADIDSVCQCEIIYTGLEAASGLVILYIVFWVSKRQIAIMQSGINQ